MYSVHVWYSEALTYKSQLGQTSGFPFFSVHISPPCTMCSVHVRVCIGGYSNLKPQVATLATSLNIRYVIHDFPTDDSYVHVLLMETC